MIAFAVESQCQYLRPSAFPAPSTSDCAWESWATSVRYELAIFKEGEPSAAAAGYFVHVFVRETQRPVPMPAPIRAALERLVLRTTWTNSASAIAT